MKWLLAVSIWLLAAGCATMSLYNLTNEESNYLQRAMSCPLSFSLSSTESEAAWARAQGFIGRYSRLKLQVATDYVLQTYSGGQHGTSPSYYITRTPEGEKHYYTVESYVNNIFSGSDANTAAHECALYIKTGELPPTARLIIR